MLRDFLAVIGDDKLVLIMKRLLFKQLVRMEAAWKLGMAWIDAAPNFARADAHIQLVRAEMNKRGLSL